ncbi:MAG: hypothetical protein R3F11_23370 [Verrucomicrobiales bacterium]
MPLIETRPTTRSPPGKAGATASGPISGLPLTIALADRKVGSLHRCRLTARGAARLCPIPPLKLIAEFPQLRRQVLDLRPAILPCATADPKTPHHDATPNKAAREIGRARLAKRERIDGGEN